MSARERAGENMLTMLDGEEYYRIDRVDDLPPFLMSIASDADLWMYVTSRGGLTAGRASAEGAFFPYETADKLDDGHFHTGPCTILRVENAGRSACIWEPLAACRASSASHRNLYKNALGNRVVFEEIEPELGLTFRSRWAACDEFGWVRTCTLINESESPVDVTILDGLRNVLPWGADLSIYQTASSLVDAYKRVDRDERTGMGIFSLTSKIVDRPEAAESLRANVVWCVGLDEATVALSGDAPDKFRRGAPVPEEDVLTGRRGNYFRVASASVPPSSRVLWHMGCDVGLDHEQLATLRGQVADARNIERAIGDALERASDDLKRNVASADGLQMTADPITDGHHFANTLFNNMRGGVFADAYRIEADDFVAFLASRNTEVAARLAPVCEQLPPQLTVDELLTLAEGSGDADFVRLAFEYLPLYFGRRHGDPSRPWNRFSIRLKNADGSRALRYEGNWRDIFQNWEALSLSFPGYLPHMIAKFVNASTVDGFNPYRLTREGIDWEVSDPEDPWSYIGYWGDHQIIYLLKFLEALPRYSPGAIEKLLKQEVFSYANVPYRIKPYGEILADPNDTILFDHALATRIEDRVSAMGADGRLVRSADGSICHVNLFEKLLVPALSKLSNFVPGGGIWMNTQRPEWNDANNALVGNGLSMVTLYYLRRYLDYLRRLATGAGEKKFAVSDSVLRWMEDLCACLESHGTPTMADTSPLERRNMMDVLGEAFSRYRTEVYERGPGFKGEIQASRIRALCDAALVHVDATIRSNRRADSLYHAYNLLALGGSEEARVGHLYEMLEGQVAALSSGLVGAAEANEVVSALFRSGMYREDQDSFLLYPARALPAFLDRNVVPAERVASIPLLASLAARGDDRILRVDADGVSHFHADFRNARELESALDALAQDDELGDAARRDRAMVLDLYEAVFSHHSYTGRSGTMYGYEGIGSIYWHMVAKLLLALQETVRRAVRNGEAEKSIRELASHYYRVRAGLGFQKTPERYGAFPVDPYSHTPAHAGARQPGMTGQVKEEILTRFGELGIAVHDGCLHIRPLLLQDGEFLARPRTFRFYDVGGGAQSIDLRRGSLAFTLCQVPFVYHRESGESWIRTTDRKGVTSEFAGARLSRELSRSLFARAGDTIRVDVGVSPSSFFDV